MLRYQPLAFAKDILYVAVRVCQIRRNVSFEYTETTIHGYQVLHDYSFLNNEWSSVTENQSFSGITLPYERRPIPVG